MDPSGNAPAHLNPYAVVCFPLYLSSVGNLTSAWDGCGSTFSEIQVAYRIWALMCRVDLKTESSKAVNPKP